MKNFNVLIHQTTRESISKQTDSQLKKSIKLMEGVINDYKENSKKEIIDAITGAFADIIGDRQLFSKWSVWPGHEIELRMSFNSYDEKYSYWDEAHTWPEEIIIMRDTHRNPYPFRGKKKNMTPLRGDIIMWSSVMGGCPGMVLTELTEEQSVLCEMVYGIHRNSPLKNEVVELFNHMFNDLVELDKIMDMYREESRKRERERAEEARKRQQETHQQERLEQQKELAEKVMEAGPEWVLAIFYQRVEEASGSSFSYRGNLCDIYQPMGGKFFADEIDKEAEIKNSDYKVRWIPTLMVKDKEGKNYMFRTI